MLKAKYKNLTIRYFFCNRVPITLSIQIPSLGLKLIRTTTEIRQT